MHLSGCLRAFKVNIESLWMIYQKHLFMPLFPLSPGRSRRWCTCGWTRTPMTSGSCPTSRACATSSPSPTRTWRTATSQNAHSRRSTRLWRKTSLRDRSEVRTANGEFRQRYNSYRPSCWSLKQQLNWIPKWVNQWLNDSRIDFDESMNQLKDQSINQPITLLVSLSVPSLCCSGRHETGARINEC